MSKSLYDVLGVPRNASQEEIARAFRKLAKTKHPDKGGDPEEYKELNRANEILSDPKKREIYDQYGEEGLREGGPGMGNFGDIFSFFGGGGGGRRDPSRKQRTRNVDFPLKVSLEQIYNGATKKLKVSRRVLCRACEGYGGKKNSIATCPGCKGSGTKVVVRQLQPGFIQQMQTTCNDCGGRGKSVAEKDKCKACKGQCITEEKEVLEVFIAKGTKTGAKITFSGKADEIPDCITGDLNVYIQAEDHPLFQRRDSNLFLKKQITLREALCGFELHIKHLDGRTLVAKSTPGKVYKPGDVKVIRREGMPLEKNPFVCGDLYVIFDVLFPESISDSEQKSLADVLTKNENKVSSPQAEVPRDPELQKVFAENEKVFETVPLDDADLNGLRHQSDEERKEAYEEDDGGSPRAQCRTQ